MWRVQRLVMVKNVEFLGRNPPRRIAAHQQLRSAGLDGTWDFAADFDLDLPV